MIWGTYRDGKKDELWKKCLRNGVLKSGGTYVNGLKEKASGPSIVKVAINTGRVTITKIKKALRVYGLNMQVLKEIKSLLRSSMEWEGSAR